MTTETKPPEATKDITLEQAQEALVHLAELVVAFAGGGIEIIEVPSPETPPEEVEREPDRRSLACLTKVVRALLDHRQEQRERQQQELAIELRNQLGDVYARTKTAPESVDLDSEVSAVLDALGFDPDEDALVELVPALHELSKSPKDFAAKLVAPFMGIKERAYYIRQSKRRKLDLRRTAFARWVPLRLARRYCDEIFQVALANRDRAPAPRLSDLKNVSNLFAALLERRTEEEFRKSIEDMFRIAFLADFDPGSLPPAVRERAELIADSVRQARAAVREAVSLERAAGSNDAKLVDAEADATYRGLVERAVEAEIKQLGLI